MNSNIERLLSDMISYYDHTKNTEEDNFLLKAQNKLGRKKMFSRTLSLFGWINPINHNLPDFNPDKYDIFDKEVMDSEDFKEVYEGFEFVFKNIPEMKELFVLKEEHVEFNPSLSKSDIQDIYL
ncbi:hypothetical protein [Winogradskyella sp. SYSU M77433]|uniref:hypothetical protein n=1 Tax=Winogradskyella sp. SYSU M77433 TaxID=3042722 RepID=UPI0024814963|nr:hypothetical protein [Winogradskyella sp. SYSU M77433]MDH7913767.1 hypothetical protein [Winogradskyella sp. SYSU M77433]